MTRILRRFYSTANSNIPSASTVAAQFLSRCQSLPPQRRTQLLDANQLERLAVTLSRPIPNIKTGTPIPACYHLIYFTPSQVESELGLDGTDKSYNPDSPFTRRMWAGGELHWTGQKNLLRVGQTITETTEVKSAEGKRTRAGEEMVVVGVEKRFENDNGLALVDRRNWIFRPEITVPQAPSARPAMVDLPEGHHTRDFVQTDVTLFRYSALTFNAHKIHYNREWCRGVEGHRELVVHGPLNLTNMVNLWSDVVGIADREAEAIIPKSISYRATSPLYAGEKYRILLEEEEDNISMAKIVDSYGNISMKGKIERS